MALLLLMFGVLSLSPIVPVTADEPPATGTPTGIPRLSYLPYVTGPLPTPTPTATPTATATPAQPSWLQYVNQFRQAAKLHPLIENFDWSQGDWLHSRYMVKEDHITHHENTSSPWYTPEGDVAGRSGNIYVSSSTGTPDEWAINFWMSGPFHAVAILDPQLFQTAFASYREDVGFWQTGATLDWQRGLDALPQSLAFPVIFPAHDGETWLSSYRGGEWPDPLSPCPGYVSPSGPPLILQLGSGNVTPVVTAHSFHRGGEPLPHCIFDETSYTNPSPSTQNSGRIILNSRDAIILMPREPLQLGESYTASVTANGVSYSWTFSVVPPPVAIAIPGVTERAGAP